MARPAAKPAGTAERAPHAARALLEQYGVGRDTLADRWLGSAAYGDRAVTVPSPDGKAEHMAWATKNASVEDVARGLLMRSGIKNPSPQQLEEQLGVLRAAGGSAYPDDAALLGQMQRQQKLASQGKYQRMEAIEAFIDKAKADEKFRAEVSPMMGFTPAPEPAPPGKPAAPVVMEAVASQEDAALAGAPAAPAPINRAGLAYHLMAKGQQQSDPVAYAAAVQSMNAY